MSALRDEIRAILREEFAALQSEAYPPTRPPQSERVMIGSSAELTRFAQDIARRAADPDFAARLGRGEMVFELAQTAAAIGAPIVSGPARTAPERLDKPLITERDIAALNGAARSVRIAPQSRLTPLARDEARRKGIRIERTER